MPEAPLDARAEIKLLRDAIHASHEQGSHMHQVFGGWEECAPCEKANDECDGSLACDAYKAWQKTIEAGHRSRAEAAVDQLEAAQATFLLPWAHQLDAKSLDNFVGDLIRAAESPLMFVVDEIHQTVAQWRELLAEKAVEEAASRSVDAQFPLVAGLLTEGGASDGR